MKRSNTVNVNTTLETARANVSAARAQLKTAVTEYHYYCDELNQAARAIATTVLKPTINKHFSDDCWARRSAKWLYIVITTGNSDLCEELLHDILHEYKLDPTEYSLIDCVYTGLAQLRRLKEQADNKVTTANYAALTAIEELETLTWQ
jgi:hypothetical protein